MFGEFPISSERKVQNSPIQFRQHVHFFGDGYKNIWADDAALGVVPAGQSFTACNRPGFPIDLRLEGHFDFIVSERLLKVPDQIHFFIMRRADGGGVRVDAGSPVGLRCIKSQIGAPQRGKKRFTRLAECKPNRDTNLKLDVLVAHRLKQFEQEVGAILKRLCLASGKFHQQGKLIPSDAESEIASGLDLVRNSPCSLF